MAKRGNERGIAWIDVDPTGPRDKATLRRTLAELGDPDDEALDHVLRVHGPLPRTLTTHLEFYRSILRSPGPLTRVEREVIGVAVSARNQCLY